MSDLWVIILIHLSGAIVTPFIYMGVEYILHDKRSYNREDYTFMGLLSMVSWLSIPMGFMVLYDNKPEVFKPSYWRKK